MNEIAAWVKVIETIRPGSTRADLLKIFKEGGGISTRSWGHFVHRECPFIKVDVEFEPVADKGNKFDENPTDTITKISKPYLKSTGVGD